MLFHPRRDDALTTERGDVGASNGKVANWGSNGYSGLCFYEEKIPPLWLLDPNNSSGQGTPDNKCMWKSRANFKMILRNLFLAVSSGLWVRASHSKSTMSFEVDSNFPKVLETNVL